jgi:hypothetical protein
VSRQPPAWRIERIGYIMPWLSLGLLDTARDVAALNLPAAVAQLFGFIL